MAFVSFEAAPAPLLALACCAVLAFLALRPHRQYVHTDQGKTGGPTATTRWGLSPTMRTWPILGSVLTYTRDPCGFIARGHDSHGDVFTTHILTFPCTFLRSQPHLTTFATASRKTLDVTKAYKLVASALIGEEAFIGQSRHVYKALGQARIGRLGPHLWRFAEESLERAMEARRVEGGGEVVDVGQVMQDVVFGMDAFVLCGRTLAREEGAQLGTFFRRMDVDLSLLGLLGAAVSRKRQDAKRRLFALVEKDVARRLEGMAAAVAEGRDGGHEETDEEEGAGQAEDEEFAEYLLRKEMKDIGLEVVEAAAQGNAEAKAGLAAKAREVSLVIYGLIWAAQTNAVASTIWIVHDLLHHPSHLARVRDELSASRRSSPHFLPPFERLPHLLACINETLRLRVTGAWLRYAEEPVYLPPSSPSDEGVMCPPGFVVASPIGIARDPKVYPDPAAWDPDRYCRPPFSPADPDGIKLDGFGSPPISATNSLFGSWGLGHSQCPGRALAYRMMCTAVALLVEKYDVRLAEKDGPAAEAVDVAAAGVQRFKGRLLVDATLRTTS